jgi:hypothetical protein
MRLRKGIANSKHARIFETAAVLALLALWSAAWVWFFYRGGYLAYYGDAEAHLNIARRILDSRTPGYDQIGSVWLPLPHVLMMPFARNDALWRSALAGSIVSGFAFVIAGVFLFAAARRVFNSSAAAITAAVVFATNPNLLYLQSTAMSEPLFMAEVMAILYFTVRFRDTQSWMAVCGAGVAALCGTLTRYDGWFLIPFVTLFLLVAAKRYRAAKAALFAVIACLGPLYWLGHNWWCCSNVLDFYNGPYSAKGIQGSAYYPGLHNWAKAWLYFRTAVRWCAGAPLMCLGAAGLIAGIAVRKAWWPALLLVLPGVQLAIRVGALPRIGVWRGGAGVAGPRAREARGRPGGSRGRRHALGDPSAAGCVDRLEGIAGQLGSAPRLDARGRRVPRCALPPRIGNRYHLRRYHGCLPHGWDSAARNADVGQLAAMARGHGAAG